MSTIRQLRAALQEDQSPKIVPGAIPAPVLGWNERDGLDGMQPGFAVQLDNFFPYNGYVTIRGGSRILVDGLGNKVETLARWADGSEENILACANGQIWRVAFDSKVSIGSGFNENAWQWDTTTGARGAGSYTYFVNGADTPQGYNGTTLAPVTWQAKSGQPTLTITNLHNIHVSKDVLFLAEKGQLGFWHSDKGTVTPAAELSWFDLGTILPNGGEIVAMGNYTLDGGDGPDDYTCFVASTGWVALYRGSDPSQATDWALVGRYSLGQALGKRCVLEVAGDVLVLTVNGYISLRQFIEIGGLFRQSFAFNDNIQPEVVNQTYNYRNEFGWQPLLVPDLTLALFNVPQSSDNFVQHIVNTQTAAWAQIKGWNGLSWLVTNNLLLFGTANGEVVSANERNVFTDVGNKEIVAEALTAFSYFGQRGTRKLFQMFRPILETIGNVSVNADVAVDFDKNVTVGGSPSVSFEQAAQWNGSNWDEGEWGGSPQTLVNWLSIGRLGYSAAVKINVRSTGARCWWKSTDINYTPGGTL